MRRCLILLVLGAAMAAAAPYDGWKQETKARKEYAREWRKLRKEQRKAELKSRRAERKAMKLKAMKLKLRKPHRAFI